MITVVLVGLMLCIAALLILLVGAVAAVSPLAFVILGLVALDICVIKSIFKKKK